MKRAWALVAVLVAIPAGTAAAQVTTESQTITGNGAPGFQQLTTGPGWARVVREDLAGAQSGRDARRRSLLYFTQLSDFQLADEESPARVEFLDKDGTPLTGAWRPQEALSPHLVDQAIRQVNAFRSSPIPQGDGSRARMSLTLVTGDNADSNQRNEVEWVVRLLDGGPLTPNSGVNPTPPCPAGLLPPGEAARYTGVQDYDDYHRNPDYYDPDDPFGRYAAWPRYPGLMDRAQQSFSAAGLAVPSYVAFGNHDGLVQGNAPANASFEAIATGCLKAVSPLPLNSLSASTLELLLATQPGAVMPVPTDPNRQFVDKAQHRALFASGVDGHGFAHVDAAEAAASNGAASYYSFSPRPGIRMIALDTVAEGGPSEGNIDDPQFKWLQGALVDAQAAKELVILFGHHPIRSLIVPLPDEDAGPCTGNDGHGHDNNPGCDRDPRLSAPIHLGADQGPVQGLQSLLLAHPNVIAYVAGHTHEHKITAFPRATGGGGFWGIETSSETDWPIQSRLLDVMDNGDGTLSIFGTLIDHAGPVTAPAPGTAATNLPPARLASIGRTLSANDPQAGLGTGVGLPGDRNVELLIPKPPGVE